MKLLLTLIAALLAAAPALGGPTPVIIEGNRRWIVIFKPQVRREGRESALATLGAKLVKHVATDGDTDNEFSTRWWIFLSARPWASPCPFLMQ